MSSLLAVFQRQAHLRCLSALAFWFLAAIWNTAFSAAMLVLNGRGDIAVISTSPHDPYLVACLARGGHVINDAIRIGAAKYPISGLGLPRLLQELVGNI